MRFLLALALICSATAASAQDITSCSGINASRARLACFDKLASDARPAPLAAQKSTSSVNTRLDAVGRAGDLKISPICKGC
jgi:hypothetical protein